MSLEKLTALVENLPEELQQEVLDYASYLLEKRAPLYRQQGRERVAGLHEGQGWVSDDFDAPLPESFWLGNEA
ncbi:hypothetical protein BH24DEI1_BH24DEI1_17250 [soil metagenome]|jgi:hypothetical protein|nr:DUF2281 domain-containing protein [Deinococcota bacterium]